MDIQFAYWVPNVSGRLVISNIPQRTDWSYDYNVQLAQTVERLGFDYGLVQTRYDGSKLARIVVVTGILFGAIQIVTVNLKGASLMVATIFGLNEGVVATISVIVILIYISLGGLWASMSTSTLMCLLIMVPSVLVTSAIVGQVGGAQAVWQEGGQCGVCCRCDQGAVSKYFGAITLHL